MLVRRQFIVAFAVSLWLVSPVARAVTIIEPSPGVVVVPGQEIKARVDPGIETGLHRVRYFWYRQGEEPALLQQASPALVATASSAPPYGGALTVPQEAIGTMRLLVVGDVARGRLAGREEFDEILLQVEPRVELAGIEFEVEKPWRLDTIGRLLEIPVLGQFADSVTRRIGGGSSGSRYESSDPRVIAVQPDGVAQVVGNGKALLTVANRGKTGRLEVVVKGGEVEANRAPIAKTGPDVTVKGGATVTLSGLQSADPDGDPLKYEWTQLRGQRVSLLDANSPTATFVAPRVSARRLLQFRLSVTDMKGPDLVKGADSFPAFINVWIEP
jgi:hypothetical protein